MARRSRAAAAGSAAAAPPASDADAVEYAPGVCYGCGARLQLSLPGGAGCARAAAPPRPSCAVRPPLNPHPPSLRSFVDRSRYAQKAAHRQTGQLLCGRCCGLSHGVLANAVAGQGTDTGAAARRPGLATPEALRSHLTSLAARKVLVLLVVDALDASGSFLPRLRDAVGANPVLLCVTKADLLPRGTDAADLASWLEAEVGFRRLTLVGLHLVSGRTGAGVAACVADLRRLRRGRDVVVVGAANVGKSTFVRAAVGAMRAAGDLAAPSARLPTASPLPGTTLGPLPLRAFQGEGTLWDTPGVVLHHRVNGFLAAPALKALAPTAPLRAREPPRPVAPGTTVYLEGLLRVDVLSCPPDTRLLFFGPSAAARLACCDTRRADADGPAQAWAEAAALAAAGGAGGAGAAAAAAAAAAEPVGAAELRARARAARGRGDGDGDGDEVDGEGGVDGAGAALDPAAGLRPVRDVTLSPGSRLAPCGDVTLSGLGGWLAVVAGGPGRAGPAHAVRLRVWAPPGAEVFVRPSLPAWPRGEW